MILDVKYAVRSILSAPKFAAVVLLTLALGIGANTAVFSVLDAVVLKPLPYGNLSSSSAFTTALATTTPT